MTIKPAIANPSYFYLLNYFSNKTIWECYCKELLVQPNLYKKETLGATHMRSFWTGSCLVKHLYETSINQSGHFETLKFCLHNKFLLIQIMLNKIKKRSAALQCKKMHDLPKVSQNYNCILPRVSNMIVTDYFNLS